jgi:hypothetical protein
MCKRLRFNHGCGHTQREDRLCATAPAFGYAASECPEVLGEAYWQGPLCAQCLSIAEARRWAVEEAARLERIARERRVNSAGREGEKKCCVM